MSKEINCTYSQDNYRNIRFYERLFFNNIKNRCWPTLSSLALDAAAQSGVESIDNLNPVAWLMSRRDIEQPNERFNVLAVHFQPRTFGLHIRQVRQDNLQHRPDTPGAKRTSPPEVVTKMLQALEEMGESVEPSAIDMKRADSKRDAKPLEYLHPRMPSTSWRIRHATFEFYIHRF